jgi:hypothetical protein
MNRIMIVLVVFALALSISGCYFGNSNTQDTITYNTTTITSRPSPTPANKKGLDELVRLGKYEVMFLGVNVYDIQDQSFEYDMAIALNIQIKNISNETIDLVSLDMPAYGPDGEEVQTQVVGAYFNNALDFTIMLQPGETVYSVYYIGYTGDGEYTIEVFDMTSVLNHICINVVK